MVGTQRGNNECTTWGEGKRNITIPCTFWSASRIIRNIVLSNLAFCIRGQRHRVTQLTHVCVYWVGPLPSTFSLMHVSLGKCTRQYAWRDASRLIERSGTAGNVKYRLLEIHHRVHHAVSGGHLASCIRPNATCMVREVSCSLCRVAGIIQSPSCLMHQEPCIILRASRFMLRGPCFGDQSCGKPPMPQIMTPAHCIMEQDDAERAVHHASSTQLS